MVTLTNSFLPELLLRYAVFMDIRIQFFLCKHTALDLFSLKYLMYCFIYEKGSLNMVTFLRSFYAPLKHSVIEEEHNQIPSYSKSGILIALNVNFCLKRKIFGKTDLIIRFRAALNKYRTNYNEQLFFPAPHVIIVITLVKIMDQGSVFNSRQLEGMVFLFGVLLKFPLITSFVSGYVAKH